MKKSLTKILFTAALFSFGLLYSCEKAENPVIFTESALEDENPEKEHTDMENVDRESTGTIYVHVCGAVVREGVYPLAAGSRYQDAVNAAGGFTAQADTRYLNLAAPLSDGQQILVYTLEETELLSEAEKELADGLVDINKADLQTLMTLSGIGQTRAEAIVKYREESGPFQSIEDIMNVPGIKESVFQKIKDQIKVGMANGKQSIGSG